MTRCEMNNIIVIKLLTARIACIQFYDRKYNNKYIFVYDIFR